MLNGVFSSMSTVGSQVGASATKYSADMKPQAITHSMVPAQPVDVRGTVGQHPEVIGESIFGQFLYGSDQVPQKTNPSWQAGAEIAAPISGFGAEVPATAFVAATAHWGGHGIFGGQQRHGEYGMTRYGTPLSATGDTAMALPVWPVYVAGAALLAAIGGGIWWWSQKKKA